MDLDKDNKISANPLSPRSRCLESRHAGLVGTAHYRGLEFSKEVTLASKVVILVNQDLILVMGTSSRSRVATPSCQKFLNNQL